MSRELTRDPVAAHYIGGIQPHTLILKVFVRTGIGKEAPTQEVVENAACTALLTLPPGSVAEGSDWDVASVIVPNRPDVQQIMKMLYKLEDRFHDGIAYDKNMADSIFVLREHLKGLLGLGAE